MGKLNYAKREDGNAISFKVKNIIVGKDFLKIGGPCCVESEEQIVRIGRLVKQCGGNMIRGGAFKPRTSPYAFQGIGREALKYLREAGDITDLPVVSEIMDIRDIEEAIKYLDIIQIGARNAQNYSLLKEVGNLDIPIILKNGINTLIQEWLCSAEYIMQNGNFKVILCERGIRTSETYTRNTLDLSAVLAIKELSRLPIIIDPSHGTGRRTMIETMCLGGVMVGCDGVMVEVHDFPEEALSDGEQSIIPKDFGKINKKIELLLKIKNNVWG